MSMYQNFLPISMGARPSENKPAWLYCAGITVVAFVFLYMLFGHYVAWQSPAVRQYYGGPEQPSFFAALRSSLNESAAKDGTRMSALPTQGELHSAGLVSREGA
jgi:hypothetical protein